MAIRQTFARLCRETRIRLDITQAELAAAVHVSRGYIANVETGRANPSIDMVDRIATILGLQLGLAADPLTFLTERRTADFVHARCSAYVGRRLQSAGWQIAREVPARDGRIVAWIDLLAFDPYTGRLLIIEVKTRLEDIGAAERQIGWYRRLVPRAARELGWQPRATGTWLVALASGEVDRSLLDHRSLIGDWLPGGAEPCSPSRDPAPRPWRERSRWSTR